MDSGFGVVDCLRHLLICTLPELGFTPSVDPACQNKYNHGKRLDIAVGSALEPSEAKTKNTL